MVDIREFVYDNVLNELEPGSMVAEVIMENLSEIIDITDVNFKRLDNEIDKYLMELIEKIKVFK